MAGESLKKYVELRLGEFAYNKGNSKTFPCGCIYQLRHFASAAVPHVYYCFSIRDGDVLDDVFFQHYCLSGVLNAQLKERINSGVRNNGLLNINSEAFFSIELLLPPLGEQHKIADILSSVDEAIEATQAVINQLQVVKKAMMAELLTRGLPGRHSRFRQTEIGEVPEDWEVVCLEGCLDRLIDYRGKSPPKADHGVPLITAKNVRDGYINVEPREYIVLEQFAAWMSRGLPDPGDVLFTTEAPLGKAAAVPPEKIALGQRLITLCPDRTRIDPVFFLWMLLGPQFQALLSSKATGSTVQGIKQSVLRKLPVVVPSLEEQSSIGQLVQGVADREGTEHAKRGALEHLKSVLMSVLFTGEIRVSPDEVAA